MFINSINHFRAIALLFIVVGHSFDISQIKFESFLEKIIKVLVSGGTINFVFISGFLFYTVFYRHFNYRYFLKNKFKRILVPYLILSILPIVIRLYMVPFFWNDMSYENFGFVEWFFSSLKYLISGAHLLAYWYIPFITLVFLMSPLHINFIKLKYNYQIFILSTLFLLAIFIHRPFLNDNTFQAIHSLFYFTPVYLFGIFCAKYKTHIYSCFKNKEAFLLFAVVGLALLQLFVGRPSTYKLDLFELDTFHGEIDLIFIQKVFMCLFFMVWLNRYEEKKNEFLTMLANFSFPIFFLHGYFLFLFRSFITKNNVIIEYPWFIFLVFVFVVIFLSMTVTVIIKKIFPKQVKFIVGYMPQKLKLTESAEGVKKTNRSLEL